VKQMAVVTVQWSKLVRSQLHQQNPCPTRKAATAIAHIATSPQLSTSQPVTVTETHIENLPPAVRVHNLKLLGLRLTHYQTTGLATQPGSDIPGWREFAPRCLGHSH
jgi:hypothetical protein